MPLCTVLLRFPFIEMSWKDAQDSGGRQRAMMGHFFLPEIDGPSFCGWNTIFLLKKYSKTGIFCCRSADYYNECIFCHLAVIEVNHFRIIFDNGPD